MSEKKVEFREGWWLDHTNLAALWHWMEDRGESPDVYEFLSTPWSWTPEYRQMLGIDPPGPGDDDEDGDEDEEPFLVQARPDAMATSRSAVANDIPGACDADHCDDDAKPRGTPCRTHGKHAR